MNFINACLAFKFPILNNYDVSCFSYCSDTKSVCFESIWQPRHVTIILDGDAGEILKAKTGAFEIHFFRIQTHSMGKF